MAKNSNNLENEDKLEYFPNLKNETSLRNKDDLKNETSKIKMT